jgi:hypothetical protein
LIRLGESNVRVVARSDSALTIQDMGPWDRFKSVTNDAEGVVRDLLFVGLLKPNQRLFYYDSDGQLDELCHDGERFTGFKPGPRQDPPQLDEHWHPYHDDRDSDDRVDYDRERQALDDREMHDEGGPC